MKDQALLYDSSYCTGCNSCAYKCIQEFSEHALAAKGFFRTIALVKDDGVQKKQCMQCKDPQCVPASQGAFSKTEYGSVVVDGEKLKDGKKVAAACPFKAVQQDEASGKVVNCNLCAHRQVAGQKPACVDACLTGALQAGPYEEMVAKAKELAAKRKLHIYGLNENGGTRVLILTKASPAALGYPKVAQKRAALHLTEVAGAPLVAGAMFVGLKNLRDRRAKVAAEETETK